MTPTVALRARVPPDVLPLIVAVSIGGCIAGLLAATPLLLLTSPLVAAVLAAAADAKKDAAQSPVVLLSPACASFDQYSDFEERGDHFRQIVATLVDKGVA